MEKEIRITLDETLEKSLISFNYNEESGMYECTFTVTEGDYASLEIIFGGVDFDFSTVEGLPEYDPATDYTSYLQN